MSRCSTAPKWPMSKSPRSSAVPKGSRKSPQSSGKSTPNTAPSTSRAKPTCLHETASLLLPRAEKDALLPVSGVSLCVCSLPPPKKPAKPHLRGVLRPEVATIPITPTQRPTPWRVERFFCSAPSSPEEPSETELYHQRAPLSLLRQVLGGLRADLVACEMKGFHPGLHRRCHQGFGSLRCQAIGHHR